MGAAASGLLGILIGLLLPVCALGGLVSEETGDPSGYGDKGDGDREEALLAGFVFFEDETLEDAVDLPEGAVVTVQLLDTSLQDVAATVLGEHVFEATQLPAMFLIVYDANAIDDRNDYTIQAAVHLGDDLLYINDTAHPVLTWGAPPTRDIEVIRVR